MDVSSIIDKFIYGLIGFAIGYMFKILELSFISRRQISEFYDLLEDYLRVFQSYSSKVSSFRKKIRKDTEIKKFFEMIKSTQGLDNITIDDLLIFTKNTPNIHDKIAKKLRELAELKALIYQKLEKITEHYEKLTQRQKNKIRKQIGKKTHQKLERKINTIKHQNTQKNPKQLTINETITPLQNIPPETNQTINQTLKNKKQRKIIFLKRNRIIRYFLRKKKKGT